MHADTDSAQCIHIYENRTRFSDIENLTEVSDRFLQWFDAFIMHAKNEEKLVRTLQRFFELCRQYDFKLHAKKLDIFLREAQFCGRIIDKDGIRYDPRGLKAIMEMRQPERA